MVRKIVQEFPQTRFAPKVVRELLIEVQRISGAINVEFSAYVEIGERTYYLDERNSSVSEFFILYESDSKVASCSWTMKGAREGRLGKIDFRYHRVTEKSSLSSISIELSDRTEMDRILDIVAAAQPNSTDTTLKLESSDSEADKKKNHTIFIGHGRAQTWLALKSHLTDQHGYRVVAYETGARAGHHIRDILDEMASESSIAFLVMTGEDELASGTYQARPNVIHETGLFQGRLGFSRAVVLLEDGCSEFSNLAGIQQIRFRDIRETFGDVLATIKRELDK